MIAAANFCGKRLETLSKIATGMVIAGMLISSPGAIEYFIADDYSAIYEQMSPNKPYIESARELGGLLIASVYLFIFELMASKQPKKAPKA